jgi:hypothetical protein
MPAFLPAAGIPAAKLTTMHCAHLAFIVSQLHSVAAQDSHCALLLLLLLPLSG